MGDLVAVSHDKSAQIGPDATADGSKRLYRCLEARLLMRHELLDEQRIEERIGQSESEE